MSDDTPTQRFEPEGSDAPTQRFDAPVAGASEEVVEERKSRKLMIILGSIGGALLLAVIILLIFLLVKPFGGGGSPTGSPTPTRSGSASPSPTQTQSNSPTPTPTPTQTTQPTQPPSNDATINAFDVGSDEVSCNEVAPGGPFPIYLDFDWSTAHGDRIYFGINTDDASQAPFFDDLPPSGSSEDFPAGYYPFEYPCGTASVQYTLTVVGSNGSKDSASVTVTNIGDEY